MRFHHYKGVFMFNIVKRAKLFCAVALVGTVLTTGCTDKKLNSAQDNNAIDPANMDLTVKPTEDFYQYVNGAWLKNNPIPEEESRWSAFNVINEQLNDNLKIVMEEAAAKSGKKGTVNQQIGDFYKSGLDVEKINQLGATPIKPYFEMIEAAKTSDDIIPTMAKLHMMGISSGFGVWAMQDEKNSDNVIFHLHQSGLGLPDRDYYTEQNDRFEKIRTEYVKFINTSLKLFGHNDAEAAKISKSIMDFETRLAKASMTMNERRDPANTYNGFEFAKLKSTYPNINWDAYFEILGTNVTDYMNVRQPGFVKEINDMVKDTKIEDWQNYMKWNIARESMSYLSDEFVQARFDFYGKTLSGTPEMKPRWKRVLSNVNGLLGEAVGRIYVEKYFPAEAKERMLKLVGNLKLAFKDRIQKLTWMSEETKKNAMAKLETMNTKIGYPDKWKDYSSIEITDNYLQNVLNASKFAVKDNIDEAGKPVDRDDWGMTPQTINAYYSPTMNEIVFPAAILQPPFFSLEADDAVNYGAIGVVIGHEMTHGFDDQGCKYNSKGNLENWWTDSDAQAFEDKTSILVNQYAAFIPINDLHLDGKMTLGENIADNGGLTLSLAAFQKTEEWKNDQKIKDFSPLQRFFLSYAQIWRNNIRDEELMKRIKEDVHSPGKYRVNGGVVNIPEFYKAFDVKDGDKMYIAPEERAKIW